VKRFTKVGALFRSVTQPRMGGLLIPRCAGIKQTESSLFVKVRNLTCGKVIKRFTMQLFDRKALEN